jgi:hypothetical protein
MDGSYTRRRSPELVFRRFSSKLNIRLDVAPVPYCNAASTLYSLDRSAGYRQSNRESVSNMSQLLWLVKSNACFRRLCSLSIASCVLFGCSEKLCPATANGDLTIYNKCLRRHESVEKAIQVGPFTTLAIRYSRGGGYFNTPLTYQKILYKGRMLATNVAQVRRWDGL